MSNASVGIVRAEGVQVSSSLSTDLILLQRIDTTTGQYTPRMITVTNLVGSVPGNLVIGTAGNGIQIKEGTNARMGVSTLVSGTVTVANTSVTASTRIFLSRQSANSSTGIGSLSVGTVTAGTSFVINALSSTNTVVTGDTSIVAWLLIEPA